jgi:nucleoid-associated protein YgaU
MLRLRKDVKVALIVGGGILAVFLVYLALGSKPGTEPVVSSESPSELQPPVADRGVAPRINEPARMDGPAPDPLVLRRDPDPAPTPTPAPAPAGDDPWEAALFRNEIPNTPPPMMTQTPIEVPGITPAGRDVGANEPANTIVPNPAGAPAVPSTHKIQAGETLSSIAAHYYGDDRYHVAILKANPTLVPERLRVGQVINLPDPASVRGTMPNVSARVPANDQPIDATKQYRVQPGDSLNSIAYRLYGDPNQWVRIYELNKQAIGENPARLRVGQILALPAPPSQQR